MNKDAEAIVYLVDDDPDVRRSLQRLFKSWGLEVQTFASPEEFLAAELANKPACLILDLKLPGMDGIALQDRLQTIGLDIPIIFISAYGTVSESVQAMKSGALEFLEKPVAEATLWKRPPGPLKDTGGCARKKRRCRPSSSASPVSRRGSARSWVWLSKVYSTNRLPLN